MTRPVSLSVGWSVSRSVLIPPPSKKNQEVALPCSHRSTCCISQRRSQDIFISSIIIFMHWLYKFLSSADRQHATSRVRNNTTTTTDTTLSGSEILSYQGRGLLKAHTHTHLHPTDRLIQHTHTHTGREILNYAL